mmetsp:Transcript_1048/g.3494  ORF Transcript_1048/g.3494 Transcript_1048/m.3494 type:complete len:199 (-) Transcript_1048:508-1104(-)|eukprot:scaffold239886_cov33-Tisochrysis_lutea.AAC.2
MTSKRWRKRNPTHERVNENILRNAQNSRRNAAQNAVVLVRVRSHTSREWWGDDIDHLVGIQKPKSFNYSQFTLHEIGGQSSRRRHTGPCGHHRPPGSCQNSNTHAELSLENSSQLQGRIGTKHVGGKLAWPMVVLLCLDADVRRQVTPSQPVNLDVGGHDDRKLREAMKAACHTQSLAEHPARYTPASFHTFDEHARY